MLKQEVDQLIKQGRAIAEALNGTGMERAGVIVEKLCAALEDQTKSYWDELLNWAEDDTSIKELCRPFGIDVDGDSYGVPDMVTCVEQLVEKFKHDTH